MKILTIFLIIFIIYNATAEICYKRLGDEFDDKITAPLHGFKDAEDYYNKCSSICFLDSIKTHTLLIQSQNDPLVPLSAIPLRGKLVPHINLQLSKKGGHVGFISGRRDHWLERRILQFIQV